MSALLNDYLLTKGYNLSKSNITLKKSIDFYWKRKLQRNDEMFILDNAIVFTNNLFETIQCLDFKNKQITFVKSRNIMLSNPNYKIVFKDTKEFAKVYVFVNSKVKKN